MMLLKASLSEESLWKFLSWRKHLKHGIACPVICIKAGKGCCWWGGDGVGRERAGL